MRVNGLLFSIIVLVASQFPPPPSTQVHWVPTSCDTVSTDPLRLRVGFKIVNMDSVVAIYQFRMEAIYLGFSSPELCVVESCEGPGDWGCSAWPAHIGSGANWGVASDSGSVSPGETQEGFAIIISDPSCCFFASSTSAVFHTQAVDTLCVPCDRPVQTLDRSWGKIKHKYR